MFIQRKDDPFSYIYRVWDVRYVNSNTTLFLIYHQKDKEWKWVDSNFYVPYIGD
jgi:hypothetical protein